MKYNTHSNIMRRTFERALESLNRLLKLKNAFDVEGRRVVSAATKHSRAQVLRQAINDLYCLGYQIQKIENLGERHVYALARHWEKQCLSGSTIEWRFSCMRALENWIGKPGLVRSPEHYFDNPEAAKRTHASKPGEVKAWTVKDVDIQAKIIEVAQDDLHVALQLMVGWVFVLSPLESWTLRPALADRGHTLMVNWGTRRPRDRVVQINSEAKRAVLDLLKEYVSSATSSLVPAHYQLEGWKAHFYEVCRRHGISRATGIVSHNFNPDGADVIFLKLCSEFRSKVPIPKEAAGMSRGVDREDLNRRIVAEYLGHSRPQIVNCYLGPKPKRKEKMEVTASGE